jgi:hypothetical protein
MALDANPPKPAANFAVKPEAPSGTAAAIRVSARTPLPDFRKLLTRAMLLTFATLVPALLIFIILKSGTGDLQNPQAAVEPQSAIHATLKQGPGVQRFSVDSNAQPTGDTIVSRNARGTIEREETVFNDGTSQITSYDYDPRKRQLRITVYNRDGSTSAKSYTVDSKKR